MKNWFRLALLISISMFCAVLLLSKTTHAAYQDSNLIDDYIYLNSGTMDANGIQLFLNSKGGALANYTDPSVNQSAAQVIFGRAQAYGINPQVILATLQKEQSLVTDPTPTQIQYDFAMGYGCPDSGSCSHPGFFTQVDYGTYQLRLNVELNSGRNWDGKLASSYICGSATRYFSTGLYPGRTVTFYNDYGTAYKTITLANAATASLYCYTPHVYPGSAQQYYSGSYNFVVNFENWFGPATGEGYTLVVSDTYNQLGGDLRQWVLQKGKRYYVTPEIKQAWGLPDQPTPMDHNYLGFFPDGPNLGRLMRPTGTLDVYFVDGGKCFKVRSPDMLNAWNFSPGAIQDVSVGLGRVPVNSGNLTYSIKGASNSTVFVVDGGSKRVYADANVSTAWEGAGLPHTVISDVYLQAMGQAAAITTTKARFQSNYFVMSGGKAYMTVDPNVAGAWGALNAQPMNRDISPEFVPRDMLTRFVMSAIPGDGRLFAVENGVLFHLSPGHAGNLGLTPAVPRMAVVPEAITPSITPWSWVLVQDASGKKYVIDGGTKRPFHPDGQVQNSWTAYNTVPTPPTMTNGFLNLLPNNGNIERGIKGSAPPAYVVEGLAKRWVQNPATAALYVPFIQVGDSLISLLPNGTNL